MLKKNGEILVADFGRLSMPVKKDQVQADEND